MTDRSVVFRRLSDAAFAKVIARVRRLYHPIIALILVNVAATLMVWVPLLAEKDGLIRPSFTGLSMDTVYRYWDGPLYLVVAKTFYNPNAPAISVFPLDPVYYAAHFPAYPLTIKGLSYILGYPNAMLASTVLFTSLSLVVLFFLLRELGYVKNALLLGVVFLFLPPRWLVYHSVGATEPMFIFLFLSFILAYKKGQYWLAGLAGALAVLTRSPGVLILLAYLVLTGWWYLRSRPRPPFRELLLKRLLPMAPFVLAPLALFSYYYVSYGDFFAYFHSGDNLHLTLMPFISIWPSVLETNWSEASIWMYLLNGLGILLLLKKGHRDLAVFAACFYLPLIFVGHHDLSRYMFPIFPLSMLIAYESFITSREFKLALIVIIPAIYIYSWSALQTNLAPETNWRILSTLLR